MEHSDPRVEDSIPAEPLDGTDAEQAAEIVIEAATRNAMSAAQLGRLLVDAGRSVNDEDELLTLLQRVAAIAQEAIQGADYTGITIDLGGLTYTAVHTDERTLRIDSEQYDAGEGPCLHASRTRSIVQLDSKRRWPPGGASRPPRVTKASTASWRRRCSPRIRRWARSTCTGGHFTPSTASTPRSSNC